MNSKRFIAFLLCIMMLSSLLPAAAFADGEMAEDEEIICADGEVVAEEAPAEEEIPAEDEASDEEIIPEDEITADDELLPEEISDDEEAIGDEEEIPEEPEMENEENGFDSSSGSCGRNLIWTLDDNGKLTISGSGEMTDYGTTPFPPWESKDSKIKTVVIEQGVTSIGSEAFRSCDNLTSVTIAGSVTSIGTRAFCACSSLTSVALPSGLEYIGSFAFEKSALTSIIIPASVATIAQGAFSECTSLASATISEGVPGLAGSSVFSDCTSLTGITIPASMTTINECEFSGCSSLSAINVASGNKNYKSVGGVLLSYDGKTLVAYPGGKQGAYTIPNGVTSIGRSAFFECTNLTKVTISSSVTNIAYRAFGLCSGLKNIIFKGNTPQIEYWVFEKVTATAYYPDGNSTWTSEMGNYGGTITWVAGDGPALGIPVISSIDNHADYMIIRWGKVEGTTSYKLAYRAGSGSWQYQDVPLSSVDGKGNPRVNLKGLTVGTTYTFIAYANFSDSTSTKSASATQVRLLSPKVTVNKYGTNASNGGFKVSWNATEGGSCYKIYYREKGGSWALYTMIPKSANTLFCNIKGSVTNANAKLPDLVAGRTYEFAVLTATSQTNITSGFPTSYTGYTF